MRFTKKIIASALAVCLSAAMGVAPAFADGNEANGASIHKTYGYTISVSAGSGELVGGGNLVKINTSLDKPVDLSDYSTGKLVVLPDEKYYVKGIRLAGHDYAEDDAKDLANPAFIAKGDAQYVVAYGLKKNQVAYTINFVDAAGNEIAPSETLYGNSGDKPVVAFRYIDGFLPTTYNLTGTLKADQPNEFTFTYNAAPGVTYTVVDNGVTTGAAPAGVAPAGAAAVADAAAAGEILGEDGTPLAAPTEIEDIDDNDNPLASGVAEPGSEAAASFDMNMLLIAGGAVLLIAVIAIAAIALRKRNKKASERE